MRELAGKVAFITGGVSGIGLGTAKALLGAGMKVAITYRNPHHRDEAMREFHAYRHAVLPLHLDVTDRMAVREAAVQVEQEFGKVHVLCNNAGVNVLGSMDLATYEDWDWMLGVNLGGVVNTLVAFLPRIKAHGEGGHVINVASMGSFITGPNAGVYTTAKFAVRGLSESLRYSLAPHGIGVSLACPGLTRSNIYGSGLHRPAALSHTAFPLTDNGLKRLQEVHALGMEPDEVGRKILDGMLRRDFYIFTHPEFKDEVREVCEEILSVMPEMSDEQAPRADVEALRRRTRAEAMAAVRRWESS